jgi:hypothetical protein
MALLSGGAGFEGPARDGRKASGNLKRYGQGFGRSDRDGGLVDSARVSISL